MNLAEDIASMAKHNYLVCLSRCFLFLMFFNIADTFANDAEQDLFSLTLEQLLNIKIVSKESESLVSSPGVVTAYDARELELLGLTSLIDFIHFVPGIEINEQITDSRTVQIRGLPANSNQKVLFMLDGVPYWMPESGDIPLSGIPLQAFERIEVIRGPGSIIYGTNASAGVINVVLRKDQARSARVFITDEGKKNVSMYIGSKTKDGIWSDFSAEIQRDSGYHYSVENAFTVDPSFTYPETSNGELVRQMEHSSFLARTGYKGFTATFQSFIANETADVNAVLASPTDYESKGMLLGLNYVHPFSVGNIELFSDWNNYYRNLYVDNLLAPYLLDADGGIIFDNNGDDNTRFRNGLSVNFNVSDNFSILTGAEYEERSTENKIYNDDVNGSVLSLLTQPPYNLPLVLQDEGGIIIVEGAQTYEKSLFVQGDLTLDKWRLVAGLRYVDNSEAGSEVSPRGSIVYSLNAEQSLKLLYAEGFNAPTFKQSAATNSFGFPQNNDIVAEKISTLDIAYTHTTESFNQVFSFFNIKARDLITNTKNIKDTIRRNGFEYDIQYRKNNLTLNSGLTYIHEGDGHGKDRDADFASRWLAKLGVDYRIQQHGISASLRSAGKRQGVDSYYLLNLNYRYKTSKNFTFISGVTNVLDNEVMHPDIYNLSTRKVQADDGIGFLVGFNYEPGY